MSFGGIDLGGTKIEARAYDAAFQELARNRIATPAESYDAMLDALHAQVQWLETIGDMQAIGLGAPGLIHPDTGVFLTANLQATGRVLRADLSGRAGRDIPVINDCRAFTLSETPAALSGQRSNTVGLVIGTGVAGGHAVDGQILPDMNGQHGEYGHLPIPASFVAAYDVPLITCGCGLTGCFETYLSGPGLQRLAKAMTGQSPTPQQALSDPDFAEVRRAWLRLAAHLIALIARTADPALIVLGGGLGMVKGLPDDLLAALDGLLLANSAPPRITQARYGDASGARGAAIFAAQQAGVA